jgi:hypothetical protein
LIVILVSGIQNLQHLRPIIILQQGTIRLPQFLHRALGKILEDAMMVFTTLHTEIEVGDDAWAVGILGPGEEVACGFVAGIPLCSFASSFPMRRAVVCLQADII